MNQFVLFGKEHLLTLGLIVVITAIVPLLVRCYFNDKSEYYFRILLMVLIWGQEIVLNIWRIQHNSWDVKESLTLHLCGLAVLVLPIMLVTKSYLLYELTYFWGIGGATQALLTPNIVEAFPDFRFIQFFVSHGLIVFAVIYATVIFNYHPSFRSVGKAFLTTVILLFPISLVNYLLDSNYFFIAHKPDTPSLLDIMGPWPWYILPLIGVGAVIFILVYLPFPLIRFFSGRKMEMARSQGTYE